MKITSLDTNVVLRFLLNDIPEQTEAAKSVITNNTCYVTDVVTTEVIYVLERAIEMDRKDIVTLLTTFLNLPDMIYNTYFLDQAIELYGAKPSLSFVDCYAVAETKAYGNYLVSFDKKLIQQGDSDVRMP
jgi:predicted nucleic-acid-binding protein